MNRIIVAYLEFAEVQALSRKPMYMTDWIAKLDDFLRMSDREILEHAGTVSHDDAVLKASKEYEAFSSQRVSLPSPVEGHFKEAIETIKKLDKQKINSSRV